MVTGSLLVPRDNSIESILRRVWKVTFPLVAWSVIYTGLYRLTEVRESMSLWHIFSGPVVYHLWFLYTLIGAYLFLPVMSGFFKSNETRTILFVLAVLVIGKSIVPAITEITGVNVLGIDYTFMSWTAGYFVIGALLSNRINLDRIPTSLITATWLVAVAGIGISTWILSHHEGVGVKTFYRDFSPFVLLGSVSLFVLISRVANRYFTAGTSATQKLHYLSTMVFGVYLLHPFTLYAFEMIDVDLYHINAWIALPLINVATFALTFAAVFILQRIPFVRALLPS